MIYEIVLLCKPVKSSFQFVNDFLLFVKNNFLVLAKIFNLGKRILSYKICGFKKAFYFLIIVNLNKTFLFDLNKYLKYKSNLLRYIILKKSNWNLDSIIE
ncbi:MAG: 30S ribosomal protein S6 [Candidatus Vidania fulgoroideorum]